MAPTRIYKVTNGDEVSMVEAQTGSQALKHVASALFKVQVATTKEVAAAMRQGVEIEVAAKSVREPSPEATA